MMNPNNYCIRIPVVPYLSKVVSINNHWRALDETLSRLQNIFIYPTISTTILLQYTLLTLVHWPYFWTNSIKRFLDAITSLDFAYESQWVWFCQCSVCNHCKMLSHLLDVWSCLLLQAKSNDLKNEMQIKFTLL